MSDIENRDAESGQFVAAEEPKYGLESVEAEAGFTRMPDPAADPEADWSFDGPKEDAATIFAGISDPPPEVVEVYYQESDGSRKDPNETVTLERAADDLSQYHGDREADMAALLGKEFAAEIDKLRADRIKTAADAEHFGVPLKPEKAAVEGAETATREPDAFDGVEGLAEETKAALRQPQVREYLEATEREHSEVRQAYTSGLENARVSHLASLAEIVPHLANLPPAQFEQGLATLSQVDPPAFQKAMNVLQRTSQIVSAQQQAAQHQAQLARQHFERYSREQDVQFYSAIGKTPDEVDGRGIVKNLESLGLTREQITHHWQNNPLMRSAAGQQILYEWSEMKSRDAKAANWREKAARSVPPVQRPGVSRPAGEANHDNIAALDAKLTRSGSIKDAEALMNARARARR
jgi:hypothetical protein